MRLTPGYLLLLLLFSLGTWAFADPASDSRETRAQELLKEGRYDEAATEFIWLWNNVVEPSGNALQVQFLLEQMGPLLEHSDIASEAFGEVLAKYRERLEKGEAEDAATAIWVVLETKLGDPDRVVTWWTTLPEPHDSGFDSSRPWVFKLLVQREQWRPAGLVFPEPEVYAEYLLAVYAILLEADPNSRPTVDNWTATTFGDLYRALLAADRAEEAQSLREFVLQRNSSEIVEKSLRLRD